LKGANKGVKETLVMCI